MKRVSLSIPKVNWPKAGDEPFLASKNPRHEARLDMTYRTFGVYALAYKEAADCVVACAIRRRTRYPNFDMFPIGFLYRHYLELVLKEIICCGRRCSLEEARISREHNLSRLWKEARPVFEEFWPDQHLHELALVENCISEFQKFDESSQGFRYPTDSKGRETLRSLIRVDLRKLRIVMTRVANFLDAACDGISETNLNTQ